MSKAKPVKSDEHQLPAPLQGAINMIGDSWTLCILWNLANGPLRFNELQRNISGSNPVTLSNRLKKLESEKMIQRNEETVDKLSVVYSLTPKGKEVVPIIKAISSFADKHNT